MVIFILSDVDGEKVQRLTEGNDYSQLHLSDEDRHGSTDGPAISPDGKQIAYIAKKSGIPQVCTVNLNGNEQRQITRRPTPCGRVRWSADGQRLAFVSFDKGRPRLYVVDAAGGEPKKLTSNPAVYWAKWMPSIDESADGK